MKNLLILVFFLFSGTIMFAQTALDKIKWSQVVYDQPEEWYGSDEATRIAENVLLYQRQIGGWPKNTAMHHMLTESQKNRLRKLQQVGEGATTDNGATCMELVFLSKVYHKTRDGRYKEAFRKGIEYLLEAQYENGGWPQFYPLREGYYTHITFNDNSMINIMNLLKDVAGKDKKYAGLVDNSLALAAGKAYEKGIEVLLKTQYRQNGKLTVWCAQHDEVTYEPVQARAYELASLSGSESAGIVSFLMDIENPSQEMINSIQSAITWFDQNKIEGIRLERYRDPSGRWDIRVVEDNNARALWARFYSLEDNQPFFCDRDGIKKYALHEIGYERRTNYSWYSDNPQAVIDQYKKWRQRWVPSGNAAEYSRP